MPGLLRRPSWAGCLVLTAATLLGTVPRPALADEGMWTFNLFPKAALKARHGFAVTDAWLERVRLASVRFNSGGSGSFVSARGLVMTNHHVGADCIQKVGAAGKDYIADGFIARTEAEEVRCPDLELNVLVGIDDVTKDIKAIEQPGVPPAELNRLQKIKMSELEKACAERTGQRCDVVTLYSGGLFHLYRYRKHTDVRLVFAPEGQSAAFGGDPDNFTFPRFAFDVAFFRVWHEGRPLQVEPYLQWSAKGARDGDLVFTSGNPGSTSRLATVAQLEFLRDLAYPQRLANTARVRGVLQAYAATSPEAERQTRTPLHSADNTTKALTGYLAGLRDPGLMAKKQKAEAELQARIRVLQAKQQPGGEAAPVWGEIAAAVTAHRAFFLRHTLTEGSTLNSRLFAIARHLHRLGAERQLPSEKRLREYRDSNLASLELGVFSAAPIYPALETALLQSALEQLQKELGDKDPLVLAALAGQTPAARAKAVVAATRLADVAVRKSLAADKKALDASQDPMLQLARALDPEARTLRKRFEDEIEGVIKRGATLLARAQFDAEGLKQYPDATFTLRLSYGKVLGYQDAGKTVAPLTTVGGMYARADEHGGKHPWDVPKRWQDAKTKLDPKLPMNFASTNDIIGGNSGSPVVDRKGEVVGLVFDGNIQSLPGNFAYDMGQNRAISVHSAVILTALDAVYAAPALAAELRGGAASPSAQDGKR